MKQKIVVLAGSGRKLAQAAVRAGYAVSVIDAYADEDTHELADRVFKAEGPSGIDKISVLSALTKVEKATGRCPIVWGSGLEDAIDLLCALGSRWPICGCPIETMFLAENPVAMYNTLHESPIVPAPVEFRTTPALTNELIKPRLSSGGALITKRKNRRVAGQREYFQPELSGTVFSASYLVHDESITLLGVARSMNLQPNARAPYRFSAAVADRGLLRRLSPVLEEFGEFLGSKITLRGIIGCDFILQPNAQIRFLELNPRPTAAFDLFVDEGLAFRCHVESANTLNEPLAKQSMVNGTAVFYAEHPLAIPEHFSWPQWSADRPAAGTKFSLGTPICSVVASASDTDSAVALLIDRFDTLRDALGSAQPTQHPAKLRATRG